MKTNLLSLHHKSITASQYLPVVLLIIVVVVGGVVAFPLSYVSNTNVVIGSILLPFCFFITGRQRIHYVYLLVTLIAGGLALAYHVRIFYFFSIAVYILFLVELILGRTGHLVLFLVLFMSPFFEQAGVILGFPIRLQLSEWAGLLLGSLGLNIAVQGNAMVMERGIFLVDDACMGLHLLSISLLMGVFSLSHFSRTLQLHLSFRQLAMFFITVFGLNILSNLFRICLLVLFSIRPESAMHDVVGMLCLVLYVMFPIYFLSGSVIRKFGKPIDAAVNCRPVSRSRLNFGLLLALAVCILMIGFVVGEERKKDREQHADVHLEGFQKEDIQRGVTKLTNDEFLVYVKPIPEFFSAEHTPLICWQGSGYAFEGIRKEVIVGREIYIGNLRYQDQKLVTAWWYDNGKTATISQAEWRLRMLTGEPDFCLVNITTSTQEVLIAKVCEVFEQDLLSINTN